MASFFRGGNGSNGSASSPVGNLPVNPRPLILGAVVIGSVILGLFLFGWLRNIYANLLWFDNLDFRSVFATIIITRIWLFALGALAFAVLAGLNVYLTYRYASGPSALPGSQGTATTLKRLVLGGSILGVSVLSLVFGGVVAGQWDTVLQFM